LKNVKHYTYTIMQKKENNSIYIHKVFIEQHVTVITMHERQEVARREHDSIIYKSLSLEIRNTMRENCTHYAKREGLGLLTAHITQREKG
jgi:hypothetical protein